jgi:YD repeat-containing protein
VGAIAFLTTLVGTWAPQSPWEVRYALPADQKPEWTAAGYLPKWTVALTDPDRPTVEISGDAEGLFRGHVLLGKRVTLPGPVPPGLEVSFRHQTYCAIGSEAMKRSGEVSFGVFTVEGFDALAHSPEQAQVLDLARAPGVLHYQRLTGVGEDVTEWAGWRSGNLARALRPYAGQAVIFAMVWGCNHFGDEEWGKLDAFEVRTMTQDEWDRRLFEALDLSRPELLAVKAAYEAGDLARATETLVEHFRTREQPPAPPLTSTASPEVIARADEILDHTFRFVGCPPHRLGEQIAWNEDPFSYDQWAIALNRHTHWLTLGQAYAATGDEKYAREFAAQLKGWTEAMPVHIGPHWIEGPYTESSRAALSLDAGIRMGQTWFPAFCYFRRSPSFGVEAQSAWLTSLYDHALYLMDPRQYHETSNWGTMEANGLLHLGLMLPEFREAPLWRDTAARRLASQLTAQVYPDGAQMELTPGYHGVTLGNLLGALRLARRVGYAMPDGFETGLERMFDYYVRIRVPDGRTPPLNDSGAESTQRWLEQGHELFPERADLAYFAKAGGEPPAYTSCLLPHAGWAVMRSGWGPQDSYLLFDAGPFGSGHQHEDKLHLLLHAGGKLLLTEPGNYSYDASDWRRYVLSTRGHNCVLVDGLEQNRRRVPGTFVATEPLDARWVSAEDFDYAVGTYADGFGPDNDRTVAHRREVLFIRPDYWIVVDVLAPSDDRPHVYEALFHLDVESAAIDETSAAVIGKTAAGGLAILPLTPQGLSATIAQGQREPVVQGWLPTGRHNELRPIPTAVLRAEGAGRRVLAYALVPFSMETSLPRVEPVASGDGALTAKLTWADGAVHEFAYGPDGLTLAATRPDGSTRRFEPKG